VSALEDTLRVLEAIAPSRLAADWDNVGLLVRGTRACDTILCAIDCTTQVVDEVLERNVDLLIAYHPPIFGGLERLDGATPRNASILRLVRAGVHVYSPHTALDAQTGGVNDWLLEAFGGTKEVTPIVPTCDGAATGQGRTATLNTPTSLEHLATQLGAHLGAGHIQRVGDGAKMIHRVAVCPGAGGSLLRDVAEVDAVITGEMRHHDQLALMERGVSVLLAGHTESERGYLSILASKLRASLPQCSVHVSQRDRSPLS